MEEPAAECAKDKSNFGRELEVGGHADEDAEHEAATAPIPIAAPVLKARPYRPRHGFPMRSAASRPKRLSDTEVSERLNLLRSHELDAVVGQTPTMARSGLRGGQAPER